MTLNTESLLALGLTDAQAAQVMESLNGAFVPKARFNEINTQLSAAKASLKERDGQLEALRKSSGDAEDLRRQITQLQADNAAQQKQHAAQLRAWRLDNAVDTALREAGAINPATVRPLLEPFLAKAQLAEDGSVPGLKEEIGRLAKDAGSGFLFRPAAAGPAVSGTAPAAGVTAPPQAAGSDYAARLADARKAGNAPLVVSIKREAAEQGIQLF